MNIPETTGHQMTVKFPPHATSIYALGYLRTTEKAKYALK